MGKPNISVAIIAQNEEEVLPFTLEALVPLAHAGILDAVVIVDGGSRDWTTDVCFSFLETLPIQYFRREFDDFQSQKNYALSQCRGDWVLSLDADMVISSYSFVRWFQSAKYKNKIIWDCPLYFCRGDILHYHVASNVGPTTRFWKNIGIRYERPVHEFPALPDKPGWDAAHDGKVMETTSEWAVLEISMLKSDEEVRERVRRYAKWAEMSKQAGISIDNISAGAEALIADRTSGTAEIPKDIIDSIPVSVLTKTPPYLRKQSWPLPL